MVWIMFMAYKFYAKNFQSNSRHYLINFQYQI